MLVKKTLLFLALLAVALCYVGWLSKERAQRFVVGMLVFMTVGFVWRVGAWWMAP